MFVMMTHSVIKSHWALYEPFPKQGYFSKKKINKAPALVELIVLRGEMMKSVLRTP